MVKLRWQPLPAFSSDVPTLLVSPLFGPSSYTLYVTDLANVWVETMDRRAILLRSLQNDTSIDLSEGSDQMDMLLAKVKSAFDPTSSDHHQTSLRLSAPSTKNEEGRLDLLITCTLPADLEPLKWPVQLSKCPTTSLTSELVLPLIQAQRHWSREVEALIANLKDKDAVIAKLVDKLENTGTGLENVFNSLTGKRKATRAAAEDKVKGLAPFNESSWRTTIMADVEAAGDLSSLIHDVFGGPGPIHGTDQEIKASDSLNDWWTTLGGNPAICVQRERLVETAKGPTNPPSQDTRHTADDDDDDFQVQDTPPHLAAARNKRGNTTKGNDSTTDEDEPSVIPDSHPTPSQQQKKSRLKPIKRLGAIGGRRNEPTISPAELSSPVTLPQKPADGDTATESEDDEPSVAKSPTPSKDLPTRRKRGLGKIGGRPRSTPEPPMGTSASPDPMTASPEKVAGRKLGGTGKKVQHDKRRHAEASTEQQEMPEAAEQKAERKRNELQKELERKAAAGPAKKKRKF
ncbi:XRCC4-like factor-domain-containing protein [Pseudomassariella vexata]|uniref:Non-homologous end-joining factor 1 n=1 Tax=Pseudomassariella vexata TaxID=1141098 RepID=A0A1Y2DF13_9PEZI|nr:XRCC4-like factor-domain-containing protein [Pseudomassariella vexata]ORY57777.1 XRCC4-like factor-domain-containing protein [Pseudomassariella vexata]